MIEILRITYYLYEFKRTKQGEVPIYCKLTTDGINRQQFSTRLYIRPEIWDKDAQCVRGTSEDAVLINRRLQDITVELKSIEQMEMFHSMKFILFIRIRLPMSIHCVEFSGNV